MKKEGNLLNENDISAVSGGAIHDGARKDKDVYWFNKEEADYLHNAGYLLHVEETDLERPGYDHYVSVHDKNRNALPHERVKEVLNTGGFSIIED